MFLIFKTDIIRKRPLSHTPQTASEFIKTQIYNHLLHQHKFLVDTCVSGTARAHQPVQQSHENKINNN